MKSLYLSIVLPTYNERENIINLINQILKILKNFNKKEIIVVDDNSTDGTYLFCKKKFEKNRFVKVILRKKNKGLANSIGDGINVCKGQNIIVMDTDLTHDPKLIPKLIYLIKKFDIVSCSRFSAGGLMKSKPHYYLSFSFNLLLRIILKTQIQDNLGGFFCINKKSLDSLPHKKIFYGYGEYFFRLLHFAQRKKFTIIEIPAVYNLRFKGKSKSNFFLLLFKYFFAAIKLRFTAY